MNYPTFCATKNPPRWLATIALTHRETGDRYLGQFVEGHWQLFINESYQTIRHCRADALMWIEQQARLAMA